MLHTWPGQTKEEWLKEYRRNKALTLEQQKVEWDEAIRKAKQSYKKYEKRIKSTDDEWLYVHAENPNSLDDGEALVSWIIVMLVGAIFNARWIIWIVATAIYLCRQNRYAIRKWKWDNGGKEEHYKKIQDAYKGDKK